MKSEEKGEKRDRTLADPGKVRGVKKTECEEKSNGISTGSCCVKGVKKTKSNGTSTGPS